MRRIKFVGNLSPNLTNSAGSQGAAPFCLKTSFLFVGFVVKFLTVGCLLSACDILRPSPFEVGAWTPGEGYHQENGSIVVSLLLSHDSDRPSVEQAFSLSADGTQVRGYFSWEGRRLVFKPVSPLEANRAYRVTLGVEARDTKGISLDTAFNGIFSTRPPSERPRLISFSPGFGETLPLDSQGFAPGAVKVRFSEPLDPAGFSSAFSFNPSIAGVWLLEDEDRTAGFVPGEPWKNDTRYTLTVSGKLLGSTGLSLEQEASTLFIAGTDRDAPVLLKAWRQGAEGGDCREGDELTASKYSTNFESGTTISIFSGWEASDKVVLEFSEPVDIFSLKSALSAEYSGPPGRTGSLSWVMETGSMSIDQGFAQRGVFHLAERPAWNSLFLIRVKGEYQDKAGNKGQGDMAFSVRADGPLSRPPELAALRLPLAPGKKRAADQEVTVYEREDSFGNLPMLNETDHFPQGKEVPWWIELYFHTAPGAGIDLLSLMDLFKVEVSNNAFDFSIRKVLDSGWTWPQGAPGKEHLTRIEVQGILVNNVNPGMVTFSVGEGLKDTNGNKSEKAATISLLK